MVNIKVPIDKKDRFGITMSPPEFTKAQTEGIATSLGDLQYLRQLSEQGRIITQTGSDTGTATAVVVITPQSGETFFFTEAFFSHGSGNSEFTIDLVKAGVIVDQVVTAGNVVGDGKFHLQFDRLVGNGIDTFQVNYTEAGAGGQTVTTIINGYLDNTKSSK